MGKICHVLLQVKKENPEISFGEVGKVLGEKWKAIGATEKAKFEEMAKKDKVCTCTGAPMTDANAIHCFLM